ncbi:MAG: HEAT repeat domain-containing protein [Verrucomicrobia bacterium]|nr:HEAT repeat domain-containing protein [Verrucomicrobiota bacterium]
MSIKHIIIALVCLIIATLGGLAFLFLSTPTEKISPPEQKPIAGKPDKSSATAPTQYIAPPEEKPAVSAPVATTAAPEPSQSAPESNGPYGEKQVVMDRIQEAISTYSAEGVPILKPLLLSPDLEIREQAIEGMKQLDAPEAAAALREAAKKVTDPRDRQAMLEAADFVDLPAYKPRK